MAIEGEKIVLETLIQRNPYQEYSTIDDEVVMLSLEKGQYYSLNPIAARIWNQIEQPIKVKDLITLLCSEYEVDFEKCESDTLECLNDFQKKSLLNDNIDAK